MDKIDFLEKNLGRQLAWIQASDTRLALVLPLSTAMLGTLGILAPAANSWPLCSEVITVFAVVLLSLSIFFCACASFPRTDGPKRSMIFFGRIATQKIDQFRDSVASLSDEEYIEDLTKQCHINAQVAMIKYIWVKRSLASLFWATPPWALAVYLLYVAK